jgi:diguanylate cyclase (GGDEF)-like protein
MITRRYPLRRNLSSLVGVSLLGWSIFLPLFWKIFPVVGKPAAMLILVLLAGLAWYGGMRYGLLQSVISALLLPVLLARFGSSPEPLVAKLLLLFIALTVTALVGYLRDVRLELMAVHQNLIETQEALRFQAEHDVLTGLHNRRYFDGRLNSEHARARRYAQPLSVVLLDIDRFKQINDLYSHAVGDRVLQEIGRILQAGLREVDCVARYGGEEFALCLASTSPEGATTLCERLRVSIETHDWETIQAGLRVTVSGGICSEPTQGPPERMVSVADRRLYMAKEAGRNRIQISDACGTFVY